MIRLVLVVLAVLRFSPTRLVFRLVRGDFVNAYSIGWLLHQAPDNNPVLRLRLQVAGRRFPCRECLRVKFAPSLGKLLQVVLRSPPHVPRLAALDAGNWKPSVLHPSVEQRADAVMRAGDPYLILRVGADYRLRSVPNLVSVFVVGELIKQLKAEGTAYKAGQFPFLANGRARALGDTTGFVKILADAKTDEILGVHIIGPMASELIAEAVMAMEFKASAEDIARICHAHPSLSESTKEAALAVDKRTLNF